MFQTTISRRIHCAGVGLHSGKMVKLVLRPAAEDTGIIFHIATADGKRDISPTPESVIATGLATTLGKGGVCVSTVEHLLAALRGLSIDNVHIDVEGGEIPIMDGSAAPFVMLLRDAGIQRQSKPRKVLRIKAPFSLSHGEKYIKAEPYNGFSVDCTIDFAHPTIGKQRMALVVTADSFAEVSRARTFGFMRDVEALQANGLALGGNLDNAVVLDERGVLNKEGLRAPDEFVRHKLLDFIGDMAMLSLPLYGKFTVHCSGHALNNQFLRELTQAGSLYLEKVTLAAPVPVSSPRMIHYPAPCAAPAMAG